MSGGTEKFWDLTTSSRQGYFLVSFLTKLCCKSVGGSEQVLELASGVGVAKLDESLVKHVEGSGDLEMVGCEDALPDVEGAEREAGHIEQAAAEDSGEAGVLLIRERGSESGREQLRQMGSARENGVVFGGRHLSDAGADAREPGAEFLR